MQNDSKVSEIYLADAEIPDSKHLLLIHENGTLELKWCYEDIIEVQIKPTLSQVGKKTILEYGEPNLFSQRQRLPFKNEQGKLDEIWEKIM